MKTTANVLSLKSFVPSQAPRRDEASRQQSEAPSRALRPLGGSGEKPKYRIATAGLLFLWTVSCLVTVVVAVALFVPGHLGLNHLLEVFAKVFPGEMPMLTD
jgi:hypothetical protein